MLRRDGAWLAAIGRIVPTEGHRRQHVPRAGAGLRAIADDFGPGIWSHLNAINWTRRPIMFTLKNLKDLTDIGSNFNGPPDLEFRHATAALGLEQSGLSYQRVPPGYRFPVGQHAQDSGGGVRGRARERADEARRPGHRDQRVGCGAGLTRDVARLRGRRGRP
jgi:hypothetical protein